MKKVLYPRSLVGQETGCISALGQKALKFEMNVLLSR